MILEWGKDDTLDQKEIEEIATVAAAGIDIAVDAAMEKLFHQL